MVYAKGALGGLAVQHYRLKPEVAGGFGPGSIVDRSVHPPRVSRLDYSVADWLGDCIVTAFPTFLLLRDTARKIQAMSLTGFEVAEAIVSEAGEFRDINPDGVLPDLVWLRVHGAPGADDFGVTGRGELVVSERILEILVGDGLIVGSYTAWLSGASQEAV